MEELNDILDKDFNTINPNFDEFDDNYVLSGDTPISFLGNIKIWQLSGCFLAGSIFLMIILVVKISRRISLGKDNLEDLEKLYEHTKTGKHLSQTNKKLFHITKQVCFLTNELSKTKEVGLAQTKLASKNEIILKPEEKFIQLDSDLCKTPESYA